MQRSAQRANVWFGAGIAASTISSGTTLIGTLNAAGLLLRPFTIIRTHLMIVYGTDQAVASESSQGVFSLQVVREPAAAAGIASLPIPINEPLADYFVYQPVHFAFEQVTAVGE